MNPKKIPQNCILSSTNIHCRSLSLIKGALQSRPIKSYKLMHVFKVVWIYVRYRCRFGKAAHFDDLTISEISRATSGTLVGIL